MIVIQKWGEQNKVNQALVSMRERARGTCVRTYVRNKILNKQKIHKANDNFIAPVILWARGTFTFVQFCCVRCERTETEWERKGRERVGRLRTRSSLVINVFVTPVEFQSPPLKLLYYTRSNKRLSLTVRLSMSRILVLTSSATLNIPKVVFIYLLLFDPFLLSKLRVMHR